MAENGAAAPADSAEKPSGVAPSALADAISAVAFLFAVFGGALSDIAPPVDAQPRFAIGIASFLALCVLLLVRLLVRQRIRGRARLAWLIVAVVSLLLSAGAWLTYSDLYGELTFPYPNNESPTRYVAGTVLTAEASAEQRRERRTVTELVASFGGPGRKSLVWSEKSIRRSRLALNSLYAAVVALVAVTVFGLSEVLIMRAERSRAKGIGRSRRADPPSLRSSE